MARVVAFIPDLLFGSNVLGSLQAAGHDVVLVSQEGGLRDALLVPEEGARRDAWPVTEEGDRPDAPPRAEVLVVDLTAEAGARIDVARRARDDARAPAPPGGARIPVLAFYAHVEADVRAAAQDAGFDLVVPRSRMAREGPALITHLLTA